MGLYGEVEESEVVPGLTLRSSQNNFPSKAGLTPCSPSHRSCSKQLQVVRDIYRAELFYIARGVRDTLPSKTGLTPCRPSYQSPLSCNFVAYILVPEPGTKPTEMQQSTYIFKRTKNFESGKNYKATWGDGGDNLPSNVISKQPGRMTNGQPQQTTGTASGGYVKCITNDAREHEMEENLIQVGSILGNLKNMALDMGNEIDAQNQQIQRITEKADTNKDRIDIRAQFSTMGELAEREEGATSDLNKGDDIKMLYSDITIVYYDITMDYYDITMLYYTITMLYYDIMMLYNTITMLY
ncbi:hypothetical protein A6R68_10299 [Neotoma lepida]|uniref:Synaptosomal-associated protein n=1 Tax=Neotoma lepida TaxID=56216 RepID=A0A1A6FZJ1_NEOLE|nr:hypothetical protein A6R68_10299 [Neotoma lepida]